MKERGAIIRQDEKKAIDWGEVRRRLERARAGVDEALTPSPEEKRKILKERARELARGASSDEAGGEIIEVVELLLGGEAYGVESSYVREVHPLKEITPLPGTPSFVLGLINVRGQIVSVVDLRRFFGLPEMNITPSSKVVIVSNDMMEFGILADAVSGVRAMQLEAIQTSLLQLTGMQAGYLKGVTGARVAVLDVGKILSDEKIVVQEEVEG